tara:strand:+ start:1474 stop:1674 length:201 start_codon:yes stop_codon:yes gene_type:complete
LRKPERKAQRRKKKMQIELGNNESATIGIVEQSDGSFLALTFSVSKEFKTRNGAIKWLSKRGIKVK